jgi:hypothetical protein
MNCNPQCNFCLKTDRDCYISSPTQHKRKTHICSECVEVCTYILLEKKYEKVKEGEGGMTIQKIQKRLKAYEDEMEDIGCDDPLMLESVYIADVNTLLAALAEKEYEITIWKDRYASLEIRHDSLKKEYAEADRTEGGVG